MNLTWNVSWSWRRLSHWAFISVQRGGCRHRLSFISDYARYNIVVIKHIRIKRSYTSTGKSTDGVVHRWVFVVLVVCCLIDWLSMVLRLRQHNIGYTADGFYGSDDPTNSVCCRCIWSCSVSHVVSLLHRTTSCSHITTLWILVLSPVASISRLCSSCWWLISVNLLNNKLSHCCCLSSAYYTRQCSTGQLSVSGSTHLL